MRVRWTSAAAADLQHISNYLKDRHPHYRQPTMRKLYEAIRSLKDLPDRGRIGREEGTRELLFPPPALCRRVPREGTEHRSLADLSHRTGPALEQHQPVSEISLTGIRLR